MTRSGSLALLLAAALGGSAAVAQTVPETFTASATVKKGGVSAKAPVRVTVTRYATAEERRGAKQAVHDGGTPALRAVLSRTAEAGFIEVGARRTPIRYASARPTAAGRLVTVVTSEPILHLGASLPASKAVDGYDVAVAIFEVIDGATGIGDLSPAAKVRLGDGEALVIDDYGATVVWLNEVVRAR